MSSLAIRPMAYLKITEVQGSLPNVLQRTFKTSLELLQVIKSINYTLELPWALQVPLVSRVLSHSEVP